MVRPSLWNDAFNSRRLRHVNRMFNLSRIRLCRYSLALNKKRRIDATVKAANYMGDLANVVTDVLVSSLRSVAICRPIMLSYLCRFLIPADSILSNFLKRLLSWASLQRHNEYKPTHEWALRICTFLLFHTYISSSRQPHGRPLRVTEEKEKCQEVSAGSSSKIWLN